MTDTPQGYIITLNRWGTLFIEAYKQRAYGPRLEPIDCRKAQERIGNVWQEIIREKDAQMTKAQMTKAARQHAAAM